MIGKGATHNDGRPGGYHGRWLDIDLDRGAGTSVPIPPDVLRSFVGGSGLGTHLLLERGAAHCDPLSPESTLAMAFSPLVGSPLTTSAKFAVVSKSPLTGRINDSLASSGFSIAGKKAGCDAILIHGQAREPSILVIDDGQVRLDPAIDLWGKSTSETQDALRARYAADFRFSVIGPAGERAVRFATLSHDGRHAGRGGTGAVLGAKRLKAIAVRGSQRCELAHPERLARLARRMAELSLGPATAKYRELGTVANLEVFHRLGALPTRNFQAGQFDLADGLSLTALDARREVRTSCVACNIGCEHRYRIDSSDHSRRSVRMEYENLFALGSLCGIGDAATVLHAARLCDEFGMDAISAGGTISFAMECVERGVLSADWLRFGDREALLRALHEMGIRQGIGQWMAEGTRHMAERIGRNTIAFAPQVKGLEIPGYEPRAMQTMALGFAVGTRGADHNRSSAYEADFSCAADRYDLQPSSVDLAIETENRAAMMDSLILCKFARGILQDFFADAAEMLQLVTGWPVTADELQETACRIVTAKKLFNVQAGWRPEEDTLPDRFFDETLPGPVPARLSRDAFQQAVVAYNRGRGWTDEGWPREEELQRLKLLSGTSPIGPRRQLSETGKGHLVDSQSPTFVPRPSQ